jgi:hypothetical protein
MPALTVLLVILALFVDLGDGSLGEVRFVPPEQSRSVIDGVKDTCQGKSVAPLISLAAVLSRLSIPNKHLLVPIPRSLPLKIIHSCHVGKSGGIPG